MNPRKTVVALALGLSMQLASAAPASEASIHELLEVTRAEALMDQMYGSIDQMVRQALNREAEGRHLSDEQRRVLALAPVRIDKLMRQELSWAKLRPVYVGIYVEAFTQEEVDGLIRFYRSPEGQAAINKLPLVVQRSMELMQVQMQILMPKIQSTMEEVVRDAKLPPRS